MWEIEQIAQWWKPECVLRAFHDVIKYNCRKVNYKFNYTFLSVKLKKENDKRWIISTVYREKYNYEISTSDHPLMACNGKLHWEIIVWRSSFSSSFSWFLWALTFPACFFLIDIFNAVSPIIYLLTYKKKKKTEFIIQLFTWLLSP